jgi:hypothetical protein
VLDNDPLGSIADYLRNQQMLIVLDNCEHVVGPVATGLELPVTVRQGTARFGHSGVPGRSEGCLAVANSSLGEIMSTLGPGRLIYADRACSVIGRCRAYQ